MGPHDSIDLWALEGHCKFQDCASHSDLGFLTFHILDVANHHIKEPGLHKDKTIPLPHTFSKHEIYILLLHGSVAAGFKDTEAWW